MGINLSKGGRIDLDKTVPGLEVVRVGLGWDANKFSTGAAYDLDVSVFVCKADAAGEPKLVSDEHFVFYGNKRTPDGAVVHSGDNRTGDAAGDDESITIDLTKLGAEVTEISLIVTIYDAVSRKQNFGQVTKSFIRLVNEKDNSELAKYSLEDDFSNETAVQFGSMYRKDGRWLFKAVGMGYTLGLEDFVKGYGGNVA